MDRRTFLKWGAFTAGSGWIGYDAIESISANQKPMSYDCREDKICLVREGIANASIVISRNPTKVVQLAVCELNYHVQLITGTKLPVIYDDIPGTDNGNIFIGESFKTKSIDLNSSKLEKQEFLVAVQKGAGSIILMGHDAPERGDIQYNETGAWDDFNYFLPMGSLYATYEFLEKCCGVRWYLPGSLGTVITKRTTLSVSPMTIRRKPWTRYRWMSGLQFPENLAFWDVRDKKKTKHLRELPRRELTLYRLRLKMGGERILHSHSFTGWQQRFERSHPEFLAEGYHFFQKPGLRQVNFAREEVVDQVVSDIFNFREGSKYDEKGSLLFPLVATNVFPVVPNDSKAWSKDDASQKLLLNKPSRVVGESKKLFNNNRASEYVFQFVNRVARKVRGKYPDIIISTLAYGDYFYPPENMVFEQNVAVTVCRQQIKSHTTKYDDVYYGALREWRNKVKHLYVWEYYNFPQWRRMNAFPGLLPRRIGRDMEMLKKIPIDGEFIEINVARGFPPFERWLINPAMEHINYYFTLKLLDDPNAKMEQLFAEYLHMFYGPAGEIIGSFISQLEERYMDETCLTGSASASWKCFVSQDISRKLDEMMMLAKASVRGVYPFEARVKLIDEAIYQFIKHHSSQ